MEKGVKTASYSITASFVIGFILSLIFKKSLEYMFKNLVKVQYYGFMVYLSIQFPYMIENYFSFFNLNKKIQGSLYFITKQMNYLKTTNETIKLNEQVLLHQSAPENFQQFGIETTFLLYNNDPLFCALAINIIQFSVILLLASLVGKYLKKGKIKEKLTEVKET